MFERLITEQKNPESRHLDEFSMVRLLETMNAADAQVAAAVAQEIPRIAAAAQAIAAALESGGCLTYIGAGTSGRLGVLDAAECPPTFGVPPNLVRGIMAGGERALAHPVEGAEDDPAAGIRDLEASGFGQRDVLVGISASGRTPYVLGAVGKAREINAVTCGLSCVRDSELSRLVQYPIEPVPGPEILTGSTRLRAGTATKLTLNMISTAPPVPGRMPATPRLTTRARAAAMTHVTSPREAGPFRDLPGRRCARSAWDRSAAGRRRAGAGSTPPSFFQS